MIAARWKLFEKAGEEGRKAFIPFYSMYIWYKLVWSIKAFKVALITLAVLCLVPGIFQNAFGTIVMILCGLILLVMAFFPDYNGAYAYSCGTGFGIGLFLLEPVFMLIMAFDDSKYEGPQGFD